MTIKLYEFDAQPTYKANKMCIIFFFLYIFFRFDIQKQFIKTIELLYFY